MAAAERGRRPRQSAATHQDFDCGELAHLKASEFQADKERQFDLASTAEAEKES